MVAWGNIIVIMFFVYYTYRIINMFKLGTKNIKNTNQILDSYRDKKILTLEEQKQFINLKFGNKASQKFKWMSIIKSLPSLLVIILLFIGYNYLFSLTNLDIKLWWALILVMVGPILFSIFLKMIGLTDNNVLIDMFWRNKK